TGTTATSPWLSAAWSSRCCSTTAATSRPACPWCATTPELPSPSAELTAGTARRSRSSPTTRRPSRPLASSSGRLSTSLQQGGCDARASRQADQRREPPQPLGRVDPQARRHHPAHRPSCPEVAPRDRGLPRLEED